MHHNHNPKMQECINNCQTTHKECLDCVAHCLEMGGKHAGREHITHLLDCADICQTNVDFMLRHSPLHQEICGVCAESCRRCAESCEQFSDDFMKQAAKAMRASEKSCMEMAGAGARR